MAFEMVGLSYWRRAASTSGGRGGSMLAINSSQLSESHLDDRHTQRGGRLTKRLPHVIRHRDSGLPGGASALLRVPGHQHFRKAWGRGRDPQAPRYLVHALLKLI